MLTPSPFCPHVLASEQVFRWQTPYSIHCQSQLEASFPSSHLNRLQDVLGAAVAPKTQETWRLGCRSAAL